jgi:spermidine synthase
MLGHMTTLIPTDPKRVLRSGAAPVIAGAASIDLRAEPLTIAEIEPPAARGLDLLGHNFNVVANPNTTAHLDDARHYPQTTSEKFDVTSDPLDPGSRRGDALYAEFFDLARHLNPGGAP